MEMDSSILISHKRQPGIMDPLMTEIVIPIKYSAKILSFSHVCCCRQRERKRRWILLF